MGKERMLIEGGHALEGQVRVSGGKNTAVAVIPATLLCDEPCTIENLPDIEDVHALADILTELGAKVEYEPGCMMRVDPRPAEGTSVSYRNAQRLRASYYLLGALLGLALSYHLDETRFHFDESAPLLGQILKVVLGLILIVGIRAGLKPLLALISDGLYWNAVRYFCMVAFAGIVWPRTFPWFQKIGRKQ